MGYFPMSFISIATCRKVSSKVNHTCFTQMSSCIDVIFKPQSYCVTWQSHAVYLHTPTSNTTQTGNSEVRGRKKKTFANRRKSNQVYLTKILQNTQDTTLTENTVGDSYNLRSRTHKKTKQTKTKKKTDEKEKFNFCTAVCVANHKPLRLNHFTILKTHM